uniref:Neurotransmitter-gated ion-channel transmembrane domain-containing protein n=1 Tax=Strigamia maritima TaxID=126957 RepID=T1J023_STRMM
NDACFKYIFIFQRIALPHILLVFLPSLLIVLLSWISFWLDVTLAAPRVSLGLTSLLTLATQFNSAQRNLPAVATIKALDIWMFVCIFMVFASLLVYAFAYICNQKKKSQVQVVGVPVAPETQVQAIGKSKGIAKNVFKKIKINKLRVISLGIDKSSRIIFPLFFLIFNIYYWNTYFTSPTPE